MLMLVALTLIMGEILGLLPVMVTLVGLAIDVENVVLAILIVILIFLVV